MGEFKEDITRLTRIEYKIQLFEHEFNIEYLPQTGTRFVHDFVNLYIRTNPMKPIETIQLNDITHLWKRLKKLRTDHNLTQTDFYKEWNHLTPLKISLIENQKTRKVNEKGVKETINDPNLTHLSVIQLVNYVLTIYPECDVAVVLTPKN